MSAECTLEMHSYLNLYAQNGGYCAMQTIS